MRMTQLSSIGINLLKWLAIVPVTAQILYYGKKQDNSAYLIDASIPSDSNLRSKFCEKIAKYSDLAMLMKRTYHLECVVVLPIIISITGLISLELKATLQSVVEDVDIMKMISKLHALLGPCRIMRSVLLRD